MTNKPIIACAIFVAGIVLGLVCGRCLWRQANVHPLPAVQASTAPRNAPKAPQTSPKPPTSRPKTAAVSPSEAEDAQPTATVEVIEDNSPPPSPEILAAHQERRERRRQARLAREKAKRDFFSHINLDLLTPEQRTRHELFCDALEIRDKARNELRTLRAAGADVPSEVQERMIEAENIIRLERKAVRDALIEASARSAGLEESGIRQLMEDLASIETFASEPTRATY